MDQPQNASSPRPLAARLLQPSFLLVAAILLICAVGLNGAIQMMELTFQKKPVDLRTFGKELTALPMELGPWKMVSIDGRLNEDVEHALGTKEYVFREYVDSRIVDPDRIRQIREMDELGRARALAEIQQTHHKALINLAVTYYTGLVDTVPHIPDRCYIADGYEPTTYVVMNFPTPPDPTKLRFITFEDQTGLGKRSRNVAYFFFVNGTQSEDPLGVRLALQDLTQRYGFFSKVELMVSGTDTQTAADTMSDFLTFAKPQIVSILPKWDQVVAMADQK